jgi:serine/threonine protein kinase
VKAVPVASQQDAERMLEYLQRLASYANPTLVPIRGAEYREGALWVMSELDDGLPLSELIRRVPPSASQVVAIGLDVLAGLQALQQLGLSHGNLHPGNVHISGRGRARLGDYALRPRFRPDSSRLGWPDPRVDLAAAGALLCAALGISPRAEGGELSQAERSVPALVAAVRVMAEGGAGRFAGAALGLFEDASGARARPQQLDRSRQELASLARGEETASQPPVAGRPATESQPAPPTAPDVPQPAARPPVARPVEPAKDRYRNVRWLFLTAALSLLVLTVGLVAVWALVRPLALSAAHVSRPSPAAPAAQGAAAKPSAAPSSEPASAGSAPVPGTIGSVAPTPGQAGPSPASDQAPSAAPAAAGAASPTEAVSQFYDRVVTHDFNGAVGLWSASMQSAYPPAENINGRFSDTSSVTVRRDELISSDNGRAVVAVDVIEVRGGRTYHWVGNWYLIQSDSGWLLDRPGLRAG